MVAGEKPVNNNFDLVSLKNSDITTTKEMKEWMPLNNYGILNIRNSKTSFSSENVVMNLLLLISMSRKVVLVYLCSNLSASTCG